MLPFAEVRSAGAQLLIAGDHGSYVSSNEGYFFQDQVQRRGVTVLTWVSF